MSLAQDPPPSDEVENEDGHQDHDKAELCDTSIGENRSGDR